MASTRVALMFLLLLLMIAIAYLVVNAGSAPKIHRCRSRECQQSVERAPQRRLGESVLE